MSTEEVNMTKESADLAAIDTLLNQIGSAEAELRHLTDLLARKSRKTISEAEEKASNQSLAALMMAKTKMLKKTQPEGLDDQDLGLHYYVAVGYLEEMVSELRTQQSYFDKLKDNDQQVLRELEKKVKVLDELINNSEKNIKETTSKEDSQMEVRKALEKDRRLNQLIVQELKHDLVDFVDLLSPNSEQKSSPLGFLIQALWTNFRNEGNTAWLNCDTVDFEVRPEDILFLKDANVVSFNPKNEREIRLKDFTL